MHELSDLAIEDERLGAHSGIAHGFFTRQNGVSSGIYASLNAGLGSGDNRDDVVTNRKQMVTAPGASQSDIASPYQVHSAEAVYTDTIWQADRPQADAVVTNVPGLAIGVVTADCGPALFADPVAGVVGAAHAGWKGALSGVLDSCIELMVENGAKRENITAVLGPTISAASYEVGPGFPDPFLQEDGSNAAYFTPSENDGHHMFDLPAYIVSRLNNLGVHGSAVHLCTYSDESRFFSYRRTTHRKESDYGRQMSAIMIKEA